MGLPNFDAHAVSKFTSFNGFVGASKLVLINYASTFIDVQQQPKDIRTEPIPHFPDGIKQFTSGKDYALNSAVRTQQWTTWRWPWPRVQNHFGKQAAGGTKGPFPPAHSTDCNAFCLPLPPSPHRLSSDSRTHRIYVLEYSESTSGATTSLAMALFYAFKLWYLKMQKPRNRNKRSLVRFLFFFFGCHRCCCC